MHTLPRSFFEADPTAVATELLGKLLVRRIENMIFVGRIVETEAYLAVGDPAAHSFVGKTIRNAALYGEAGHAYIHAMRQYHLLDIVTESVDQPSSVLIRALEPLRGIDMMKAFRNTDDLLKLASGPGRLCQALQIDRSLNMHDMTEVGSTLYIAKDNNNYRSNMAQSTRIGISKATEAVLRFYVKNNLFVSRP